MSRVGRIVAELEHRFRTHEAIREVLEVSVVQESLSFVPDERLTTMILRSSIVRRSEMCSADVE